MVTGVAVVVLALAGSGGADVAGFGGPLPHAGANANQVIAQLSRIVLCKEVVRLGLVLHFFELAASGVYRLAA